MGVQVWAQFCCIMWGTAWCEIISHLVDSEARFYKYRFPILFFRGVLNATLITLCPYR